MPAALVLARPRASTAALFTALLVALLSALRLWLRLRRRKRSDLWPNDEWVNRRREKAIDPDMEIIDPHHHLGDPRTQPKGWDLPLGHIWAWYASTAPGDITAAINKLRDRRSLVCSGRRQEPMIQPYMGREFLLDIRNRDCGLRGHSVVKTVYLELGWPDKNIEEVMRPLAEVAMAEQVHEEFPGLCNGIVAHADLLLPDVERTLEALALRPLVKGVRQSLSWSDDPDVFRMVERRDAAADPQFRRGLALLPKYGLVFETHGFHTQLEGFADLARAFPEQVIILDHIGMPIGVGSYTREGSWPKWEQDIRKFAQASKNVYVKLSGLGMCVLGFRHDEQRTPPSSAQLAEAWGPYFRVVLDAFGVHRCMFASNFPVDKVSADYTILWNAFKLIVKDYPAEEKRLLFYENARRIYRL